MEPDPTASNRAQNGVRDARTHVNRQKTRDGIEPPRTVAEQLDEVVTEPDAGGRRRRDPVAAAEAQADARRDNGVGGAIIDMSQRANAVDLDEGVFYEKPPRRHEKRAAGKDPHEDA